MPLITLKTNLKDIKFGRDRLNGGSSNQPYIQFPRDEGSTTSDPFKTFFLMNRTTHDFPVRGGGLLAQLSNGLGSQTISNQIDKTRIENFLKDGERGPAFIRKQTGLQLSNPLTQTGGAGPSFNLTAFPGIIENTRIYNNGRNTLTSVQFAGTGTFLNRAGSLPFNPREKWYYDTMREEALLKDTELMSTNRLLILQKLKLSSAKSDPWDVVKDLDITKINNLGISIRRTNLFDYLGGPGSVYGVGSTTIKRSDDTSLAVSKETTIDGKPVVMNTLTFTYDKIMEQSRSTTGPNSIISIPDDFRTKIDGFSGKKLPGDYKSIETRFMEPGTRVDKINTLRAFTFDNAKKPWDKDNTATYVADGKTNNIDLSTQPNDDLVKFVFECISNDDNGQGDKDVALFFRAYLGSITDNHKASWNSFKYLGRGENFYTYQGFDRSFSTSFKIAIGSDRELEVTYDKLNYLISQIYPDYNLNSQFMRAPLMRLTIGDYLYRAYGFLENVDITVDSNSPWEIEDGMQLPHFVNVSFGYKIIEKTLPQRGKDTINQTKFIAEPMYRKGQTGDTITEATQQAGAARAQQATQQAKQNAAAQAAASAIFTAATGIKLGR